MYLKTAAYLDNTVAYHDQYVAYLDQYVVFAHWMLCCPVGLQEWAFLMAGLEGKI